MINFFFSSGGMKFSIINAFNFSSLKRDKIILYCKHLKVQKLFMYYISLTKVLLMIMKSVIYIQIS